MLAPGALGVLIAAAGVALLLDLGGSGRLVIRRLTSRSLGTLAPGYAATRSGFRVYAILLVTIGAGLVGVALAAVSAIAGAIVWAIGFAAFLVASAVIVAGEVRTYRDQVSAGGGAEGRGAR